MATMGYIDLPIESGSSGGVTSLNSLTGDVVLVPGSGITITPSGQDLVIAATGSGAGTVTSVGLSDGSTLPIYDISGSPITTSGTLTFTLATQTANQVFAGPTSGSAAQPTFRALTSADLPAGVGSVTSVSFVNSNGFAGTVANPTTTPSLMLSTTITGILYGNGTSMATAIPSNFPTLNQNTTGTAANITATSNSTLTSLPSLVLPGSQVSGNISGNAANITATSNSTLTSLPNLTLPTTQLSGDISLTSQVSGVLPIANGGTGQTTANSAFDALSPMTTAGDLLYENATPTAARLPIGTSGQLLTVVGGEPTWATPATNGTVTSVSVVSANGLGGTVATPSTTPAITLNTTLTTPVIAGNGTALIAATTTGTGSIVVLNTSPTLVTPALGTPSSGVLTNATGLPLTTGVTGVLPIANGGTNLSTTPANGALLIGNGTNYTQTPLTAGGGISITNASGSITIANSAPFYTVTTVSANTTSVPGTTYLANTSGGSFTITLPMPVSGGFVGIKDSTGSFQTNPITIAPFASEMIEGVAASKQLFTNWGCWSFFSDGTNWFMGF